mgnify:FL=1
MGLFDFFKKKDPVVAVVPDRSTSSIKFAVDLIPEQQKKIDNYYRKACAGNKPYQGATNEEICIAYPVYELRAAYEKGLISLKHAGESIEVHHSKLGHLGFVPDKDIKRVLKVVDTYEHFFLNGFKGGNYKTVQNEHAYGENEDEADDDYKKLGKIIKKSSPYGVNVIVKYYK